MRTLPNHYEEWPDAAKSAFQDFRNLCRDLHLYIDVTEDIMFRVQNIGRIAEERDSGDGKTFVQAANVIKAKFLTQTFH
jgi:hypothetical protein